MQLLPVEKDNFERLWQDGEPWAVVQAGKVIFVLVGGYFNPNLMMFLYLWCKAELLHDG